MQSVSFDNYNNCNEVCLRLKLARLRSHLQSWLPSDGRRRLRGCRYLLHGRKRHEFNI